MDNTKEVLARLDIMNQDSMSMKPTIDLGLNSDINMAGTRPINESVGIVGTTFELNSKYKIPEEPNHND
ncbi:MAG: hypothetical protein LBS21_08315 [Clostridiales bacterium]|jgi:hypothetical protein|nr:hypothetical protein [Clostridiales bacterium]